MKKIKIYFAFVFLALLTGVSSCSSDDKLVDDVLATTERGLILRTAAVNNATFDFFDPSVAWSVTLEAQDAENGALLSEVEVYMSFVDDGTAGTESLVKTIPASDFTTGPFGLPRGEVSATLAEVLSALGLQDGDYDSSDSFNIRLVAVLTDGREYTNNAAGTVLNGSFFSSPFGYSAQFFCALADASDFDGNYTVVADAWADYNAGETVPVEFVSEYTFRILSTNNPFIANPGTSYMELTIDPSDGSVTVASNECFDYGPGFCLDVTGSGSVGTCTGDINVIIDFGGFTNNAFSLVRQ